MGQLQQKHRFFSPTVALLASALALTLGAAPALEDLGVCHPGSVTGSYPPASVCQNDSCFLGSGCDDVCDAAGWTAGECVGVEPECTQEQTRIPVKLCRECDCPSSGLALCVSAGRYPSYGFPYTYGADCSN